MGSPGYGEVNIMPTIKASATGRIGDENYTGVITKTVLDALNGIFMTDTLRLSLKPTHIALGSGTCLLYTSRCV